MFLQLHDVIFIVLVSFDKFYFAILLISDIK